MTLTNYEWKQDKEDEQGYYFILSDTLHHLDYNVVLVKDNGQVMVNGSYIDNVPHALSAAIAPRIDYFMAMKKLQCKHGACGNKKECSEKSNQEKKQDDKKKDKK